VTEGQLLQVLRAGHPFVYTGFVAAGALSGGALIRRDSRDWPLSSAQRIAIIATVFLGGLVGAALPAFFSGGLMQERAERYLIGPKTILGGLIAGFFAVALYKRAFGIVAQTSDAFARGTCLMMAIGRLGCYAAHCCLGIASSASWAQDFGDGIKRLPIQLLEAAILGALFCVLQVLHEREALQDRRLFLFFTAYGLARFVLEFWREPVAAPIMGLGFYQWLALLLAFLGIWQVLKRTRSAVTPRMPVLESW